MQQFSELVGSGSIGVYAADKPDANISPAALSPSGQPLLARAKAAYRGSMEIPAVAGFVGGWTLFHYLLPQVGSSISAKSIPPAPPKLAVPGGDLHNPGGVNFPAPP